MLRAHSIGPKMVGYFELAGITTLREFKGADPHIIAMRIDIALGRKHMNRLGVEAIKNLIELANREA